MFWHVSFHNVTHNVCSLSKIRCQALEIDESCLDRWGWMGQTRREISFDILLLEIQNNNYLANTITAHVYVSWCRWEQTIYVSSAGC